MKDAPCLFSQMSRDKIDCLLGKEGGKRCHSLATVTTILEDVCAFKLTDACTRCTSVLISLEYFYNLKLRSFKL